MVYVDSFRVKNALTTSCLITKYPQFKEHTTLINFMVVKLQRFSSYQKIGRRLLTMAIRNVRKINIQSNPSPSSFDDFIKKECVREYYILRICHEHKLEEFKCVEYLTNFMGLPITKIIEHFTCFNLKNDITYTIRNNSAFNEPIKNILTTYMVIYLAQLFSIIEAAMKSNNLDCMEYLYTDIKARKTFNDCTINLLTNGDGIENIDKYLNLGNTIDYYFPDGSDYNEKNIIDMVNVQLDFYKKLYNFFMGKSTDELLEFCEKNIDFKALVSRYFMNRSVINKNFVTKFLLTNENFILANLLKDVIEDFDDRDIVKDLRLPEKQTISNGITIEI